MEHPALHNDKTTTGIRSGTNGASDDIRGARRGSVLFARAGVRMSPFYLSRESRTAATGLRQLQEQRSLDRHVMDQEEVNEEEVALRDTIAVDNRKQTSLHRQCGKDTAGVSPLRVTLSILRPWASVFYTGRKSGIGGECMHVEQAARTRNGDWAERDPGGVLRMSES